MSQCSRRKALGLRQKKKTMSPKNNFRLYLIAAVVAILDLAAGYQISIVGEPKNAQLVPGESVDLFCEAFGTPVPTIQWLKNGKLVQRDSPSPVQSSQAPITDERKLNKGMRTFQMSTTSSKIRIPCAGRDSIGLYTCVASNGRETVTANATVKLIEKSNVLSSNDCPKKRSDEKADGTAAEIYMWTDSRMERPGVSVQLMCRAAGNPTPKIFWYETSDSDNEFSRLRPIYPDNPDYTLLSNGDLLVKKTPADVAVSMFKCKAINEYGKDSVTSMLLEITDDTNGEPESDNEIPQDEPEVEKEEPLELSFPL